MASRPAFAASSCEIYVATTHPQHLDIPTPQQRGGGRGGAGLPGLAQRIFSSLDGRLHVSTVFSLESVICGGMMTDESGYPMSPPFPPTRPPTAVFSLSV